MGRCAMNMLFAETLKFRVLSNTAWQNHEICPFPSQTP
jgi:hypothetical protein